MQQTRNRISSGARNDGYLSTRTFPEKIRGRSRRSKSAKIYRRSNPPSAPRTSARPTEPHIAPPTDLPRSATTPPTTLLVTERVTLRAMIWPVDNLLRDTLVPKIVPTIAPICPRIPPPPAAPPADDAVPATRFCSTSYADSESIV